MIKNLIKITYLNKKKIVEMCVSLLPRVGYARVTNSGIIILKKSKWSLFRRRLPVTDVVMKYLPIEIGKLICKKDKRDVYIAMFHDKVATIVSLIKYTDKLDLLDTIYKEYLKACYVIEPVESIADYTPPIIAKIKTYGIIGNFNQLLNKSNKHSLYNKIEKLKEQTKTLQIFTIINVKSRAI